MTSGGIYLRQENGLVRMVEQPYEKEDVLQALLADYPDLLAGDQADGEPRRWLLMAREVPVGNTDSQSRWSVDHLFVDQDAIPTIVEVKRSSDTRIRREIVGQMLEYAANAVVYWRVEDLRAEFEATARKNGVDPGEMVAGLLDAEQEPEEFWGRLKTNLAASKVRLVFVADKISPELRRLVEFLNEQMQSAEVLAVEVKQYVDSEGHHQTLVPRLVGQTEKARQAKGQVAARRWNETELLQALQERHGSKAVQIAQAILRWSEERHLYNWYGRGQQDGSLTPGLKQDNGCYPFVLYTYGSIGMQFQSLSRRSPFDQPAKCAELQTKLQTIPGVSIPDDSLERQPSFPLNTLENPDALKTFFDIMDWVFDEYRNAIEST